MHGKIWEINLLRKNELSSLGEEMRVGCEKEVFQISTNHERKDISIVVDHTETALLGNYTTLFNW